MLHVENAVYLKDYQITVSFNDGSSHIVDFKQTILNDTRPIISELKNLEIFKDFSIQHHTISWSNGLDFAPEFIKSCSIKTIKESAWWAKQKPQTAAKLTYKYICSSASHLWLLYSPINRASHLLLKLASVVIYPHSLVSRTLASSFAKQNLI